LLRSRANVSLAISIINCCGDELCITTIGCFFCWWRRRNDAPTMLTAVLGGAVKVWGGGKKGGESSSDFDEHPLFRSPPRSPRLTFSMTDDRSRQIVIH
jgi:hypothetical protein